MREKLPSERPGFNKSFSMVYFETDESSGQEVRKTIKIYITANMYEDGRLGEVFIRGDKQGGMASGALEAMSITLSIALQHGTPLKAITDKWRGTKFGPSGLTGDKEFRTCTSVFDLVAQYLDGTFPNGLWKGLALAPVPVPEVEPEDKQEVA